LGFLPVQQFIQTFGLRRAITALALAALTSTAYGQPTEIRFASWNMGDFSEPASGKASRAWQLLSDRADVLALQECPAPTESAEQIDWFGVYEHSNAILSRWPITDSGLVAANPAWPRDLPWANIQPPAGPEFRVYSVHLTFRRGATPFLAEARAIEARRVLTHSRNFEGPVIIAGDFNSIGWILGGQASEPAVQLLGISGYNDALATIGGRTHALLGRLDWIYSRGLLSTAPFVGEFAGSDHRWISASFSPNEQAGQQMPPSESSNEAVQLAASLVLALFIFAMWRRRGRSRHS
jgi:endonuclease/exonuclease/phosphatase (EEP) superfamily protein YafD